VTTGRADRTPLQTVIGALRARCSRVNVVDLEGNRLGVSADTTQREIERTRPDCVIILGDRYEALAAANVATYYRTPIAHIHGGEASFGSFDNQIRDAITKLSHVHFVAAEKYRMRVVHDLGEAAARVFVVGAPGLDNLPPPVPAGHRQRHFVVTWHPETLGDSDVRPLLEAISRFPDRPVFWTRPNVDPGAETVLSAIGARITDMTPDAYIGACCTAAAIIGNSSSGIIEAPSLRVPTVNIGRRQAGRLRGPSVRDCDATADAIVAGIEWALAYDGPYDNPYGGPGASTRIAETLTSIDMTDILIKRW